MAGEINAQQRIILMLSRKTAEQRVASFLIELAATHFAFGDPSSDIDVVMTRAELGSYLGLAYETVSRVFSHFQDRHLLAVSKRHVRILDMAGLKHLAT
jgi:CRP/FNR family transcriptional regulator